MTPLTPPISHIYQSTLLALLVARFDGSGSMPVCSDAPGHSGERTTGYRGPVSDPHEPHCGR